MLNQDTIIGCDNYGNLRVLEFSSTQFMDKILKVSVKACDLVEQFRVKKREKIKSFMKNLPFKKNVDPTENLEAN